MLRHVVGGRVRLNGLPTAPLHCFLVGCDSSTSNPDRQRQLCRGAGWGVRGKQVGSMNEEPQVRGCYNITFICTPTNQETVQALP